MVCTALYTPVQSINFLTGIRERHPGSKQFFLYAYGAKLHKHPHQTPGKILFLGWGVFLGGGVYKIPAAWDLKIYTPTPLPEKCLLWGGGPFDRKLLIILGGASGQANRNYLPRPFRQAGYYLKSSCGQFRKVISGSSSIPITEIPGKKNFDGGGARPGNFE